MNGNQMQIWINHQHPHSGSICMLFQLRLAVLTLFVRYFARLAWKPNLLFTIQSKKKNNISLRRMSYLREHLTSSSKNSGDPEANRTSRIGICQERKLGLKPKLRHAPWRGSIQWTRSSTSNNSLTKECETIPDLSWYTQTIMLVDNATLQWLRQKILLW